jgi:hypothetical protein
MSLTPLATGGTLPTIGGGTMTFQAYLDNIEKQTGVSPDEMVMQAIRNGLTKPGAKSRPAIDWLMAEYGLSNAYAMAIIRLLRDRKLLD